MDDTQRLDWLENELKYRTLLVYDIRAETFSMSERFDSDNYWEDFKDEDDLRGAIDNAMTLTRPRYAQGDFVCRDK